MSPSLKTVVIEPTEKHSATVIWLHGLGDSGVGWLFLAETLAPKLPYIKWILPDAPLKPITANGGISMPAWFDINGFDKSANLKKEDEPGMLSSVNLVNRLIEDEIQRGIPADRIVLGGFSQGCVIALLTGFTTKYKLAGIIGCSGWLALGPRLKEIQSDANKQTPFLICHGDQDDVVKHRYGRASAHYLNKIGFNATFNLYEGLGHVACPQELADIEAFLQRQLPSQKSKL